jgi:hypothetical protein
LILLIEFGTYVMKTDASKKNSFDLSSLSPELQKEVLLLESEAQAEIVKFVSRLKNTTKIGAKTLQETLNESGLNLQDKNATKEVFEQTILQRLESVTTNIVKYSLGREESAPLSVMLLEAVIDVLDSVQDFKIKIDKVLPIKSDEIIKHATPVLLLVANTYAPSLGVVLKNTGALEKVASFLKDDNLKSTIYTLRETLGKLNKQSGLEVVNKTVDLSVQTGVLPTMLAKLGLSSEILETVIQGVVQTPALKSFVKDVSAYADKIFPQSQKEIDETLELVKKSAISSMEKTGVPKELIEKVEKQIDKHIVQVKATLQETLDPDVSVFDKIKIQQNSANKMLDCIKDVTNTIKSNISDPKNAELVTNVVVEALQNGIKDRLRGDVAKIATQVQDPQIKEFAKKALGAGHANLIDIAKGLTKSLGLDSPRSM